MLPLVSALLVLWLASAVAPHRFDWVDTLPDCWQQCLANAGDACRSSRCICDASQTRSYLPAAVSCQAAACHADEGLLDLSFLLPLQAFCRAAGNAVPDDAMSSAYAAATSTRVASPTVLESTRSTPPTSHGQHQLTAAFTSAMTRTATNADGQTLHIIVPLVMGPDTLSFGFTVTSTSVAPAPSSTAEASAPASTPPEQQPQAASSTSSPPPQRTSNSNGSPFENMQAGAGRRRGPGLRVGVAAVAGLLMRL